jgi:PEGA domain
MLNMKTITLAGRVLCSLLLICQTANFSAAQEQHLVTSNQAPFVLQDGTPIKLRISQSVSSADAHVNDRVEFEVLEDVMVDNVVLIPKGSSAIGTVTEAQPKRRMARGGKLEIVLDSVRMVDGEKVALRAVKEAKGGGHTGGMTIGIVAGALVFLPAAPLFLLMHGKDITIPKGTEVPCFVDGDMKLDPVKFQMAQAGSTQPVIGAASTVAINSKPVSADIYLDQNFVGNTPSTINIPSGKHSVSVRKPGYQDWVREMNFSGGTINLTAELVPGSTAPAPAVDATATSEGSVAEAARRNKAAKEAAQATENPQAQAQPQQ